MEPFLRLIGGNDDGLQIPISGPRFIIGRDEESDFRPPSDLVSRQHCAININGNTVTIEDLNSRNGTFVNGDKITGKHVARPGDSLRIGGLLFELALKPFDLEGLQTPSPKFLDSEQSVTIDRLETGTIEADDVLRDFFDRDDSH